MTRTPPSPVTFAAMAFLAVAGTLAPPTPAHAQNGGARFSEDLFGSLRYRYVGPSRGGRVTAVAGHRSHPATFYMGATGGGVWKTTDYGHNWSNISDGYFGTGSIGAIRVAESNPNVVYVSTGSDGLRSNVIIGDGVYKSTDAGETWQHIGLELTGNSGAILIHPEDPELVYVAAIGNPFAPNPERGVYRSSDGGANWENVLFVTDSTGAVDLEFAPDDPNTIYASMWRGERKPWTIISGGMEGGVYVSRDGGDSWEQATAGLPTGLRGKSDLAVSAADPDRVYALIEAPPDTGGVYRSDDRGATWRQVTDFQPILNRPFYYMNLEGHPTDPDILWGMAEGHWMSTDGGVSWQSRRTPHGDNHDLWINPDNPDIMIQSNDGGANVSIDGGNNWSTQLNQPTAELYQVDVSDDFPYRLYAGQQDNSTISVPSLPERSEPGGASEVDGDAGAFSGLALDLQIAAVGLGDVLDDGEAEAGAAELPGTRLVHAVEPLGEPGQVLFRDAAARVRHGQRHPGRAVAVRPLFEACTDPHLAAVGGVLEGVVDQIDEQLLQAIFVAQDVRRLGAGIGAETDELLVGLIAKQLQHAVQQRLRSHMLHPHVGVAHLQVRQGQQIVDEPAQALGVARDDVEELPRQLRVAGRVVQQRLGVALYSGQRRTHLMGDVGDEIGADLFQPLHLGNLVEHQHVPQEIPQRVLQPRGVDREPAVIPEGQLSTVCLAAAVTFHHFANEGLHFRMA